MKRLIIISLVLLILLTVCGCSQTGVNENSKVKLTFIFDEQNINVTLEDDEAEKVIDILGDKTYASLSAGVPSCGFDKNISLKIGNNVFAIACDTCNTIQDCENQRYVSVSEEEIKYIHSLFEKYGGFFPCI